MKNYGIIDAHCHIFPDAIAKKATDSIDIFYGISKTGIIDCCAFVGTAKNLIDQCTETGVERCVVTSVATTPHHAQSINNYIASEVTLYPEKFIGLGSLHPESNSLEEDAEHLAETGLHGVKLHPDIQKFKVDDPKVIRIFEICNEKGLPVLLHTGDSRFDNSNPDRVEKILKRFPELTIIGAHLGGWSIWEDAYKTLSQYPNFYVDTCSSFYALSPDTTKRIFEAYGTDKVIFGTDFPMWRQQDDLEYLMKLNLSEGELTDILHNNILRALNIK